MNKGDTFVHQGVTYTVTNVVGDEVMAIAQVDVAGPREDGGEPTKAIRRIRINTQNISA